MIKWADEFPLNLRLFQVFLEASFDLNKETTMIKEVNEVLELIKKTWLGKLSGFYLILNGYAMSYLNCK